MRWELSLPDSAMPSSYLWTWDHSCNWTLDDPGILTFGCANRYLKRPGTFVEDYRRLADFAAGIGVKGIVIWGFLRDFHGGVDSARKVADYAASREVAVMPGVGLTWYGGPYFEGDNPYNLETFLKDYPEARMVIEPGTGPSSLPGDLPGNRGACPTHPAFREWIAEGLTWLMDEFEVGGVNLENGDFVACRCPRCEEQRQSWPAADPDFFRMQALAYLPAAEALAPYMRDRLVTWATYTGFSFGLPSQYPPDPRWPPIGERVPEVVRRIHPDSVAQWTLTGVVRKEPLPLSRFLDDGEPEEALGDAYWPSGLKAPSTRSAGFIHQGSQWAGESTSGRYGLVASTIKEACLRAHRSGIEGLCVHGETTSRNVPWALNYLFFAHFTRRPDDSLIEFGRRTLAQALGSEDEGEEFVRVLAAWDSGTLADGQRRETAARAKELRDRAASADGPWGLDRMHFWNWMEKMACGAIEPHTASFY